MTQHAFNFARDKQVLPRDTHVSEPAEMQHLTTQNAKILARLQRGPASNVELAKLSLKYTSRLSDLRKAGLTVTCKRIPGGLSIYTLG